MICINVMTWHLRKALNSRRRRERHPDECRRSSGEWAKRNPGRHLKYKMGIGAKEHFQSQLEKQNMRCAICDTTLVGGYQTHQDHNHSTKQLRGALCRHCNTGLGNFKDRPDVLSAAMNYLRKWNARIEVQIK